MSIKEKFLNIVSKAGWLKGRLHYKKSLCRDIERFIAENKTAVFLVFTPEHANLGDHAIAYAEKKILDSLGANYYEISNKQLEILVYYRLISVLNGSVLLVNGGGNLGSLWTWIEDINRQIILNNPDSTIVFFPNSIYYSDSSEDRLYFEESRRIYNNHKKLYLYAREKISYDFMKESYHNVKLIPDMVLSLDFSHIKKERSGCIFCFRDDNETYLNTDERAFIKESFSNIFDGNCRESSTLLDYDVSVSQRENELIKKFNDFASAQLVITDRLHGMIFAAITGTNCIVMNCLSPKLRGCYEWIKHLDYIRFVDSVNEAKDIYATMTKKENQFDNSEVLELIKELTEDISAYINS